MLDEKGGGESKGGGYSDRHNNKNLNSTGEEGNGSRAFGLDFNLLGLNTDYEGHILNDADRYNENSIALLDEARYNLATRIMSNGVEVIVAGDKSTLPGEPNVLRIIPSGHYKPMTLAPSTLKGDHMLMIMPPLNTDVSIR